MNKWPVQKKNYGSISEKLNQPTLKGLEPSTSVLGGPRATIAPKGLVQLTFYLILNYTHIALPVWRG
jgi:hypothetical protein